MVFIMRLKKSLQIESNRIDSQSQQLMRRQEQMKKQSEYLRKNQEKITSQIRGKSGNTSSKVSSLVESDFVSVRLVFSFSSDIDRFLILKDGYCVNRTKVTILK
jgi:hypothetical protein